MADVARSLQGRDGLGRARIGERDERASPWRSLGVGALAAVLIRDEVVNSGVWL
jgi:hypothetical protein